MLKQINVGQQISLSAKVQEFRSSTAPDDLTTTELSSPSNIVVLSTNNTVTPVVLGKDRSPPTQLFNSLDIGPDGFLSVPNNSSRIDTVNAPLQPDVYGMDFWASLEGQLVKIPSPVGIAFPNSFGEIWVYGDWPTTGKNSRGGLTMTFGRCTSRYVDVIFLIHIFQVQMVFQTGIQRRSLLVHRLTALKIRPQLLEQGLVISLE